MPTIFTFGSYRVVVYPNDHRPAHVHVIGPDGEAVFNLRCPGGPLELRESFGLSVQEVNRIARQIEIELAELCKAWKEHHDDY